MNEGPESINPLDRLIRAYESDKAGFASTTKDGGGRRGRCFNDANKFNQRISSTAEFGPNAKEFSEVIANAMFQGKDPLFSLPPYSTEVTKNIMELLAKLDKDLTGDPNGTEIEQQQAQKWNRFWDQVKNENNLSDTQILQFQYDFITSYRYQALELAKINGMVIEADNPIANAWRKIEDYLVVVSMRYRDPKSSPQQVYDAFFKTFKIKNKGEVDDRIGNIVAAVKANDMNRIEHEIDVLMTTKMVRTFGKVVVDEALSDLYAKLKQEGLFTPEIEAVVNNKIAKIRDMEILAKMLGTPEAPVSLKQADQIYQHFSKPEQSKESVDFLIALGKLGDPPQRAEVEVIINQFMREDAPQLLNLDIRKQKEVIRNFEQSTDVNQKLFNNAKAQVIQMIKFDDEFKKIMTPPTQESSTKKVQEKEPQKSPSPKTLRGIIGLKERTPSPEPTPSPPKSPRSPRNPLKLSLVGTIRKKRDELAQIRNANLEKSQQGSPPPSPRSPESPLANVDERNRAKVAKLLGPEAVNPSVEQSVPLRQPEPTPPESPPSSNPSSPRFASAMPNVDEQATFRMGSGRTSPQTVQTESLEQKEDKVRAKPLPAKPSPPPNKPVPQLPENLGPRNTFTPSFAGLNPLHIGNLQEHTVSFGQAWSSHIKDLNVNDFKYPDNALVNLLKGAVERMSDAQKNGNFTQALNTEMEKHVHQFGERAVEAMKIVNAINEGKSPKEILAQQSQREPESPRRRGPGQN